MSGVEKPSLDREPDLDHGREFRAVATIVGALTAFGLFLALRPAPPVIARPATMATMASPGVAAVVVVHVAGAVRAPGLYELHAGSRVADAIEAAGGARPRADLALLNLAEPVRDGMQILVSARGEDGAPMAIASAGPAMIDLNSADQAALEMIPGIGPVKAAAILAFRTEVGSFTGLDQLLEVTGIGPATLEAIRPYVTI